MPVTMTRATFFARFKDLPSSSCWVWPGVKTEGGYGRATIAGVACKAHRLAAFFSGKISSLHGQSPDKLPADNVLHTCDNPACCNPLHLFVGSQAENIQDMFEKKRNPARPHGENNHAAKLSDQQVAEIKSLAGTIRNAEIARMFQISKTHVGHILRGKSRGKPTGELQ